MFLFEPRRIIPFEGNSFAPVQFQDPSGHVVEKIPVVCHGKNGPFVLTEMKFEPGDRFGVEMIRRFVEEQHIRLLKKKAAERDTAPLSAGEHIHRCIAGGTAKGIHGLFKFAVDVPRIEMLDLILKVALFLQKFLDIGVRFAELRGDGFVFFDECNDFVHTFFDNLFHRFRRIQLRFLRKVTERYSLLRGDLADVFFVQSCNDSQQRALPGAIQSQHADLCAVKE